MKIRIILTGGTIDQSFVPTSPKHFVYDKTHIDEMLNQARSRLDIRVENLMSLNSEDINDEHLKQIVSSCEKSSEDRIVITHGTNSMPKTAKRLGETIKNKTIVLTGAMVPFTIGRSDALFNLGAALTAVQLLNPGVYITMNGKIFNWKNVEKNKELGEFQPEQ